MIFRLASILPTLLLTSLMLHLSLCDCPISPYPSLTTIGTIQAAFTSSDPTPGSQTFEYPLSTQLQNGSHSTSVTAVTGLDVQKNSPEFGWKIEQFSSADKTSSIVFRVSTVLGAYNNTWQSLTFSFIINDDPSLIIGAIDSRSLVATNAADVFNAAVQIPSLVLKPTDIPKLDIFISGLDILERSASSAQIVKNIATSQDFLGASPSPATGNAVKILSPLVATNGVISFQLSTANVNIQFISFTYLLFLQTPTNTNLYNLIFGTFTATDQAVSPVSTPRMGKMMIMGISSLQYPMNLLGSVSLQIASTQQLNQFAFVSQVVGANTSYQIKYFSIETTPKGICAPCPDSPILFQEFCVSSCPEGFISSVNAQGVPECQKCDIQNFMLPSQDQQSCVCAAGRYMVSPNTACLACPYDCLTCNSKNCLTCDTNPPVSLRTLNPQTLRCQCPAVGYFDDSVNQNRQCIKCNFRCQTCTGPQSNQCSTCPAQRMLQNGMCVCLTNFIENNGSACVCTAPYALSSSGQCMLVTTSACMENQVLVPNQSPITLGQTSCGCKAGFTKSALKKTCVPQCQSAQLLNQDTGICECLSGFIRNAATSLCAQCSPATQVYNHQTKKCDCIKGLDLDNNGQCVSCPAKSYFNSKTNQCECIYNYYQTRPGASCIKCTSDVINSDCQVIANILQSS